MSDCGISSQDIRTMAKARARARARARAKATILYRE